MKKYIFTKASQVFEALRDHIEVLWNYSDFVVKLDYVENNPNSVRCENSIGIKLLELPKSEFEAVFPYFEGEFYAWIN